MLHNRTVKDKLLKGGAWVIGSRMATAITLFSTNALLARILTPEEMGKYFLIFSLVSFFAIVAQMGLKKVVVKHISGALALDRNQDVSTIVLLSFLGNLLGAILVCLIIASSLGEWAIKSAFGIHNNNNLLLWVALWVVALSLMQLMAEIFRGFHDLKMASLFGGVVSSTLALVMFYVWKSIHLRGDVADAVMLSAIAWCAAALISLYFVLKVTKSICKLGYAKNKIKNIVREMIKVAWPLWISEIFVFGLLQFDLWIVGAMLTASDTAIYGAAARFIIVISLPLMLVNALLPPIIGESFARAKLKSIEPVLRGAASLAFYIAIISLIVFSIFGYQILIMAFGEFYTSSYTVLMILMVGKVIDVFTGSCGLLLAMTGHQKTVLALNSTFGIITVAGAIVVAPINGTTGVATIAASGLVIQNMIMMYIAHARLNIFTSAIVNPWAVFSLFRHALANK